MIRTLFTIGYERSILRDFIDALTALGVDTVLDIRELPLSRKKGFSKSALATALKKAGIKYRHERALGCPPVIRNQLRTDGDYVKYFRGFNRYLASQINLIDTLVTELDGRVALLCYERDAAYCHRSSVAASIEKRHDITPQHVAVPA